MAYFGTQPNDVKKNTGLYTPSEILQLTKDGSWGGSLELIEEQTVSSAVSNVAFTSIKGSEYDVHLLQTIGVKPDDNDDIPNRLRFYESGVLETASVYQTAIQFGRADGTFLDINSTSSNYINIGIEAGTGTGQTCNSYAYIYNANNSSKYTFVTLQSTAIDNANGNLKYTFGGGVLPQTSTVDGLYLFSEGASVSQIASGTFKLFGVKQI